MSKREDVMLKKVEIHQKYYNFEASQMDDGRWLSWCVEQPTIYAWNYTEEDALKDVIESMNEFVELCESENKVKINVWDIIKDYFNIEIPQVAYCHSSSDEIEIKTYVAGEARNNIIINNDDTGIKICHCNYNGQTYIVIYSTNAKIKNVTDIFINDSRNKINYNIEKCFISPRILVLELFNDLNETQYLNKKINICIEIKNICNINFPVKFIRGESHGNS